MWERLKRLEAATSALITEISPEVVLHRVGQVAAEVIGARYAAIGVIGPDGKALESFTTCGIDSELRASIGPLPSGHGVFGLVLREARPIRLPDLTLATLRRFAAARPATRSEREKEWNRQR